MTFYSTGPVRLTEDTTRTVYQPQVKILKRNPDGLPGAGDMAAASRYLVAPIILRITHMFVLSAHHLWVKC